MKTAEWFSLWMTWVLLAMESHDKSTGLEFDSDAVPARKAAKLKQAAATGQITVTVRDPEPFMYLVRRIHNRTLRLVRGVDVSRVANWRLKRAAFPVDDPNPMFGKGAKA